MKECKTRIPVISTSSGCGTFAALAFLALVSGVAIGQSVSSNASTPTPPLPDAPGVRVILQSIPTYQTQPAPPQHVDQLRNVALRPAHSEPLTTPTGARLITLQEAQEKAAPQAATRWRASASFKWRSPGRLGWGRRPLSSRKLALHSRTFTSISSWVNCSR